MHASVEQLLTLRDGEPVAADAAAHVGQCSACSARLEQLRIRRDRLRALPFFEPPAHVIDNVLQALTPHRSRWYVTAGRIAAAAAIVALVAVGVAAYLRQEDSEALKVANSLKPTPEFQVNDTQLASLVGRSRELDDELRQLPQRPSVQRVSTSAAIDTLQARIEWVDAQLSYAPDAELGTTQARQLWGERVNLMDSLLKVRDAEAVRYAL
jgi:hypothetical protein